MTPRPIATPFVADFIVEASIWFVLIAATGPNPHCKTAENADVIVADGRLNDPSVGGKTFGDWSRDTNTTLTYFMDWYNLPASWSS